jgi:hypothetical protein
MMSQELSLFVSRQADVVESEQYTFLSDDVPLAAGEIMEVGQFQAVHLVIPANWLEMFLRKINMWFEDRDEVIFVASGTSAQGMGFILLEWEGCRVDPLFLRILENEEMISDFTVYVREDEVE